MKPLTHSAVSAVYTPKFTPPETEVSECDEELTQMRDLMLSFDEVVEADEGMFPFHSYKRLHTHNFTDTSSQDTYVENQHASGEFSDVSGSQQVSVGVTAVPGKKKPNRKTGALRKKEKKERERKVAGDAVSVQRTSNSSSPTE